MSDADRLLDLIEEGVVEHGGDLGGWTRRDDGILQLFDGRATLRAELNDDGPAAGEGMAHAHVFTTLHEHDDEVLDACLFGMGEDRESAIAQAALVWMMCVAGPIRSFLDGKPVCMTCQAGVQGGDPSEGYSEGDYGLSGLRAFVGPSMARGLDNDEGASQELFDATKPWFRFAAESAAPRRVHLAKATILCDGEAGWRRELEIDGHDVSFQDPDWPAAVHNSGFGYVTRFAVFEFPRNSAEIARRAELERTIRHFAENYPACESIDELMDVMVQAGFDADLVHEAESVSTIAFGRVLFEPLGVNYSSTIIRARRDGRIETDVPLLSLPAYTRGRAIAARLRNTMPEKDFQTLGLYNAESQAILKAVEGQGEQVDLSQMTLYPCVVPDRGVSQETMDAALARLRERIDQNRTRKKNKPWWKFW